MPPWHGRTIFIASEDAVAGVCARFSYQSIEDHLLSCDGLLWLYLRA